MSVGETPITIVGNLVDDPEMRFTPASVALARFTIASTPRAFDKTSNAWKDGTALFMRCTAWRDLAEHTAESLTKGMRVIATGRLVQNNRETPEGEKRSMLVHGGRRDRPLPALRERQGHQDQPQRHRQRPRAERPVGHPQPANTSASGGNWGAPQSGGSEPPF